MSSVKSTLAAIDNCAGVGPYLVAASGHICLQRSHIRRRGRDADVLRFPPYFVPPSCQRLIQAKLLVVALALPPMRIGGVPAIELRLGRNRVRRGGLLPVSGIRNSQQAGDNPRDSW